MSKDDDTLQEGREQYAACIDGWGECVNQGLEDLRFGRMGEQWPIQVQNQRQAEGRPCLTINRMPAFIRQVVNDGRQNRPSIKVRPVDSGADVATADIIGGVIRHIEARSDADVAYDTGLDTACSMGFGFIGVEVEYACDDTFDLECRIVAFPNPLAVTYDPLTQAADSSDWRFAFVSELMPTEEFKDKYPGLDYEMAGFESDSDIAGWYDDNTVRVAKWYHRIEKMRKILMLSDGTVVDKDIYEKNKDLFDAVGAQVQRERETSSYEIIHRLITGKDILDEKRWSGSCIPIAPVYGDTINVEGRRYFNSLIHDAKDAQRVFNYSRTAATELVSLAPKTPFIGEAGAFDADIEKWQSANSKSWPFIEYTKGKAPPQRQPMGEIPQGPMSEAMAALDDMKQIIGISDPSLGMPDQQVISGVAKRMERYESDTSTFHFIDNQHRAIRCVGRILLDLIPQIYTGPRIARIIGADGKAKPIALAQKPPAVPGMPQQPPQPPPGFEKTYDLTAGKYDLVVEAGPSYSTRREEASDMITEYIRAAPQSAGLLGPMLARLGDWPEADKVSKLLETTMPPDARAILNDQPPPPPAPPVPPPEVMVAQAKAQADIQLSHQKAQQDFQLEQQANENKLKIEQTQAQADIAVMQQKAQAEMQIARERAALEMQLKREEAHLAAELKMMGATQPATQIAPGVQ